MLEKDFYANNVKSQLAKWGDHNRVENIQGDGTPDISYAIEGRSGWIETKVPHSGKIYFEKFQISWLKGRLKHTYGKDLWVLCGDGKEIWLYDAKSIIDAPKELRITKQKTWLVVRQADLIPLVRGSKPYPWSEVKRTLTYT